MMIKNIKLITIILVVGLLVTACNSSSGKKDTQVVESEEAHNEEENVVLLTKKQIEAIDLKFINIEKRNITKGLNVTGMLELAPQDKADISPILGGVVNKLYVFEGDVVKKGQVLLTLSNPDFIQLQQDYVTNLHDLEFKEQEYKRQKRLYEEKVGSGREFQKVTSEYRTSKSIVEALKVKLHMLGLNTSKIERGIIFETMNIVSPINGVISLVETNIGAYVEPLSKVFEIVDNDMVHADFKVYEKDISKVKIGQKIIFTTSSLGDLELESEIYAISPAFEENPKAAHIHSKIKTKNKVLTSGMYIQGKIIADNVLTNVLPEQSIVREGEQSFIFVKSMDDHSNEVPADEHEDEEADDHVHEDETKIEFKKVQIITGISSDNFVEVKLLDSLPKNAQIAANGAYYLLAEMGKGETEHSH